PRCRRDPGRATPASAGAVTSCGARWVAADVLFSRDTADATSVRTTGGSTTKTRLSRPSGKTVNGSDVAADAAASVAGVAQYPDTLVLVTHVNVAARVDQHVLALKDQPVLG